MPELNQITVTRVVASPAALDAAQWSADALVFRTATDELFVYPAQDQVAVDDAYAIVLRDGGHAGVWLWVRKDAAPTIRYNKNENTDIKSVKNIDTESVNI